MAPHPPADPASAEASALAASLAARAASPVVPMDSGERAALHAAQEALGGAAWAADAATRRSVELLGAPATLAVVAGQQAGLLGGPLYAFHKAAAAVATARALGALLARPVVPVFWLASDDHDFEEVRTAAWTGIDGESVTFTLAEEETGGAAAGLEAAPARLPAFARRFGPGVAPRLAEAIRATTHPTEFREAVLEELAAWCGEGMSLVEHVGRLFARLFAGTGLLLVAPHLAPLRRRAVAVLRRELETAGTTSRLVIAAGERIAREGGTPTLHRTPDAVNCFYMAGGARCRMRVAPGRDGMIEVEAQPGAWRGVAIADAVAELEAHPERFSPNVVTRPVVQDAALPTAAMIAGPGERAYFRQLGGAYDHLGVTMPWIAARPELVLLEPRVRRGLERLRTPARRLLPLLRDGAGSADAGADTLLRALDQGPRLLFEMDRLSVALGGRIEALGHALPATFTRSRGAMDRMREQVGKAHERLREAVHRDAEQAQQELAGHLAKVRTALMPGGEPQERVANVVVPFLVNYGPEAVARWRDLVPAAGAGPTWWSLALPPEAGAAPERLDAPEREAALWQGADI